MVITVNVTDHPERSGRSAERRPQTLEQAHLWLGARQPADDAPAEEHQCWHELCAVVYLQVAVTDPVHADWAREWATAERETAFRLEAQIAVRAALESYLGSGFFDPG